MKKRGGAYPQIGIITKYGPLLTANKTKTKQPPPKGEQFPPLFFYLKQKILSPTLQSSLAPRGGGKFFAHGVQTLSNFPAKRKKEKKGGLPPPPFAGPAESF